MKTILSDLVISPERFLLSSISCCFEADYDRVVSPLLGIGRFVEVLSVSVSLNAKVFVEVVVGDVIKTILRM